MTDCFAGLDWASRDHAVCVLDASGAVRDRFEVTQLGFFALKGLSTQVPLYKSLSSRDPG